MAKRMLENEKRYLKFLETASDAVFLLDARGYVLHANEAGVCLTGYDQRELTGLHVIENLTPPDLRETARTDFQQMSTIGFFSGERRMLQKNGEMLHMLVDCVSLDDGTIIVFCKDQTDIRGAHEALRKSEELFRGLLERAGDAIFVAYEDGSFQFVNDAACDSLGYSRDELMQLKIADVDPLFTELKDPEKLWTRSSIMFESLHRRKDGSLFPVEVKGGKIRLGSENVVLGMARDISDRQERDRQIQREARINLAQVEIVRALTAPDATIQKIASVVYDWAMRIIGSKYAYIGSLDESGSSMTTYKMDAMMEAGCRIDSPESIVFEKRNGQFPSLWGYSLNMGRPFYTNDVANHPLSEGIPEGHVEVKQFLTAPCLYEGQLVGQISVANPGRDFTDDDLELLETLAGLFALGIYRKRAEETLIAAKETAEAASRSKSEFLANVSHELRTPLNGIFGMLELVGDTPLTQDQSECIETAKVSGRNLLQVINDVLDISKVEAGKIELERKVFSPRALFDSVALLFTVQAGSKGLAIFWDIDDSVGSEYIGDQGRIRQILFNLVGNSIKFTHVGKISVTCSSLASPGQGQELLLFMVTDTGIGIPEDKIDAVFRAFEQVDGSYTRGYQGTGLGLGIVKRFVDLMGGTITVDSLKGVGTTIAFTVRVERVLEAVREEEEPVAAPLPVAGLYLLLAEDDRINRLAASRLLEKRGHMVDTVENGLEAVQAFRDNEYDCILMDIQMPGMNGMEATRVIRESEEVDGKSRIPIIALTAHAMKGDRETFLAAGMDGYLSKPLDTDALDQMFFDILQHG
ncbi:PAS domain S-box protein [uncultured Pseudodesulfovibrio sp.]|uniref:PAS domain S-box protein n=1 Tax=uncultured Pseudodesulfovibrio sp. TaxID=2035858 RepID=UPI0029C9AC5D|nr:PAS domain S-box protein [uncultured Pseudodesulfovibrio sp.]